MKIVLLLEITTALLQSLFYSLSLAVQLSLCLPSWLLPFLEAAILDADRQS